MKWFEGAVADAISESRAKRALFVVVILHAPGVSLNMKWFEGAVADAISESRAKRALFVVVILHAPETHDEKSTKMTHFWEEIDETCDGQMMVAIRIFDGTQEAKQFAQIYPVPIIPASYIIDLHGKPLDVITITEGMDDVVFTSRVRTAAAAMRSVGTAKSKDGPSSSTTAPSDSGDSNIAATTPQNENGQPRTSDMTAEEKAKRARELLQQKHAADEERRKKEEHEKELERRNAGKLMAEARAAREEREARELAEQRRRDKLESQQQLKRLREQIKADREERQRREARNMTAESVCNIKPSENKTPIQQPIPSEECRIQCRFPDGSTLIHQFPSSSKFDELIELVRQKRSSSAMVPSGGSGLVSLVQYVLVAPFQVLYHLVLSFFGYGTTNVATHPSRSDGGTDRGNNYISGDSGRFSRQEGNIRRFHNEDDSASRDHDDEARWNGNSTQQL
uniref:UBX domain-containing protein 4 n=1 Tax=Ascaris lumbricoides TaxID=6252 RepID=A0A0M3IEH3_ASCLU